MNIQVADKLAKISIYDKMLDDVGVLVHRDFNVPVSKVKLEIDYDRIFMRPKRIHAILYFGDRFSGHVRIPLVDMDGKFLINNESVRTQTLKMREDRANAEVRPW